MGSRLKGLPNRFIEKFIAAKAPRDARDRQALETLNLNANREAGYLASDYQSMLAWFNGGVRSLRLERDFPFVGQLNDQEVVKARWKSLNEQVEKCGGIDRMAFSVLPITLKLDLAPKTKGVVVPVKFDAAKMTEKVSKLLDSNGYKEFVGADGKKYSFTDDEKKLIKDRAKVFFEKYEEHLVLRIMAALGSAKRDIGVRANDHVEDNDIVAKLEKQMINAAKVIITAKHPSKRIKGKLNAGYIEVVDYKYDLNTRIAAARALADTNGSFRSWSKEARSGIGAALKADIDGAINANNLKAFKDSQLSRPLREWYLNQTKVLAMLPIVR